MVKYDAKGGAIPPDAYRKELMQGIILKIAKWLIQYVEGYHVAKNGGGRKKK